MPTPSGLGTEAVGIVEAVGPGVSEFKVGDRVCYISGPVLGACSTYRNYPTARLLPAPKHMKDEEVAAVLLDRKSVVSGKSVSVRVDLGGRLIIKNKIK